MLHHLLDVKILDNILLFKGGLYMFKEIRRKEKKLNNEESISLLKKI
ncbi:hypothetical protein CBF_1375 [Clostridium botulinum F str. 230613]|nr:hypothetical protein CBF_1375 [Clostridium botulinum F str. 230613]